MTGKPENFDKLSDRFKLTLLQMEKRFVDLEASISDVGEKMKDINMDTVTAMQKRVEDIEDLIMVEQAGILEIKNMMEAEHQRQENFADVSAIGKLEDRLNKIDQSIKSLSVEQPNLEVEEKVKKFENDLASLTARAMPDLGGVNDQIAEVKNQIEGLKSTLNDQMITFERRVREVATKVPERSGVDFDFVSSKIDGIKAGLDIMTDKKVETDLKIAGIDEKIALLDNRIKESLSQKFLDEIKINKRDIMTTNVRVESVEKVLREVTNDMHEIGKTVKKFENFERLTLLNKEIEEKLQRFKFIEDETSRLSSRMELLYNDLDKRLEVIRSIERNFGKVSDAVSNLMKEVDKNRIEMNQRMKKEDVQNMIKGLEQHNTEIEKMFGEFENRIRMITKSQIGQVKNEMEGIKNSISGLNPQDASKLMEAMSQDIYKNINEIKVKVSENNKKAAEIASKVAQSAAEKKFNDKLGWLDDEIKKLNKIKEAKQPMEIGKFVSNINTINSKAENLSQHMNALEGKLASLERNMGRIQQPNLDVQISELVNKLVFLETRMGAFETVMSRNQDMVKTQPIILE